MYRSLVRLRLRWYGRASGALVLRHWQWFVLAGVILPGTPVVSVFVLVAGFLSGAVAPGLADWQRVLVMIGIDGAAVLWILPQSHALSGGAFMRFVGALPVPGVTRLGVEATLLVAANGVILVSAGLAIARMASSRGDPFGGWCLLAVLGLAAMAQRAVLSRRLMGLAGVVLGDGLLAVGLSAPDSGERWLLLGAAILCGVVGVVQVERVQRAGRAWRFGGLGRLGRRAPALLTQCKSAVERPAQTILRLGAAILLALGAARLMVIFRFDGRALPMVVVAMGVICLVLAGFYRRLSDARRAMAGYMAALPLPGHYWPLRDTGFVLLLNAVPLAILLSPQLARGGLAVLAICGLAVTCQGLLALLRWPVVHGGRRSLLYGVLLTAVWSGAAIAAVSR